jgi:hypothetical protein
MCNALLFLLLLFSLPARTGKGIRDVRQREDLLDMPHTQTAGLDDVLELVQQLKVVQVIHRVCKSGLRDVSAWVARECAAERDVVAAGAQRCHRTISGTRLPDAIVDDVKGVRLYDVPPVCCLVIDHSAGPKILAVLLMIGACPDVALSRDTTTSQGLFSHYRPKLSC